MPSAAGIVLKKKVHNLLIFQRSYGLYELREKTNYWLFASIRKSMAATDFGPFTIKSKIVKYIIVWISNIIM